MLAAFGEKIIAKRLGSDRVNQQGVVRSSTSKEKSLSVVIVDSTFDDIKPKDKFIIARYSGIEIEHDGEDLLFLNREDIIAKIKEEKK